MKIIIKVLLITFIYCSVLVISGCQQVVVDGESAMQSSSGLKAESLLPSDVWMVLKVGTNDKKQLENLDNLLSFFPSNFIDLFKDELSKNVDDNLGEFDISFEDDLMPAVGDQWEMMLVLGGDLKEESEPNVLVVFMPEDPAKLEEIIKMVTADGSFSEVDVSGYTVYSIPEEDLYFVLYKEVLLVGNDLENLQDSLKKAGGAESLLADGDYQKGVSKMQNQIGFMYINPSYIVSQLQNDPEVREEFGDVEQMIGMASSIKGEFFGVSVEEDGLRIKGLVYVDQAKWEQLGLPDIEEQSMVSYMYKKLPGLNTGFYFESSNIKLSMELLMDMYKDFRGFSSFIAMIKSGLAGQGLDLDDDILVFMDKGYAMEFNVGEGFIPYAGLYIDAVSSPESATNVMEKIFNGIEGVIDSGELDPGLLGAIDHTEADCGGGKCYSLSVKFDEFPEESKSDMPEDFLKEKLDFQYGVNGENIAFFTLYPGFISGDFETLDKNEDFVKSRDYIPDFDMQVSYINFDVLMDYVDKWVKFGTSAENDLPEDGMGEYELVKLYISPFRFLIMGARELSDEEMEMQAFIKIGQ